MAVNKKSDQQADFSENLSAKEVEEISELVNKLFDLTSVDFSSDVQFDEKSKSLHIKIDSKDNVGLLIGGRGRTIDSLQRIIASMIRGTFNKAVRVSLNVGDWREKEHEKLEILAKRTAERAIASGSEQYLYNLSPADRRVVHTILSEDNTVETESSGEGPERFLIVRPKQLP